MQNRELPFLELEIFPCAYTRERRPPRPGDVTGNTMPDGLGGDSDPNTLKQKAPRGGGRGGNLHPAFLPLLHLRAPQEGTCPVLPLQVVVIKTAL